MAALFVFLCAFPAARETYAAKKTKTSRKAYAVGKAEQGVLMSDVNEYSLTLEQPVPPEGTEAGISEHSDVPDQDDRPVPAFRTVQLIAMTAAEIEWKEVPGASSYRLYCRENTGSYILLKETKKCRVVHRNLKRGAAYYYRIRAVWPSVMGECAGEMSDAQRVVTLSDKELSPVFKTTTSSISLSWKAVTGAEGYFVSRLTSDGYKRIADLKEPGITVTDLWDDTAYTFRIIPYITISRKLRGGSPATFSAVTKKIPKKWIFTGDSYCTTGGEPTLPTLIAKQLGIEQFTSVSKGGYGVVKDNYTYLSLYESIPADETVTHVMIIGGIFNDREKTKPEVTTGIRELAAGLRRKFPNARLLYAIGNWHGNAFDTDLRKNAVYYQRRVTRRLPWYKEACGKAGILFLNGPEYALRGPGNDDYFYPDLHHPNEKGRKRLAEAIAAAVKRTIKNYA